MGYSVCVKTVRRTVGYIIYTHALQRVDSSFCAARFTAAERELSAHCFIVCSNEYRTMRQHNPRELACRHMRSGSVSGEFVIAATLIFRERALSL